MLIGSILPTLLWMAWPNGLVMVLQSAVGLIETYFVGQLGTSALAGVSLVFPMTMLMTMMSAGALGGGTSSSIARALGAGDAASAERFAGHAVFVSLLVGCAFGLLFLVFGRPLYRLMGAQVRLRMRPSPIPIGYFWECRWSGCSMASPASCGARAT